MIEWEGEQNRSGSFIISSLKLRLCGVVLVRVNRFVQVSERIVTRNGVFITTISRTKNTHRSTHAAKRKCKLHHRIREAYFYIETQARRVHVLCLWVRLRAVRNLC